MQQRYGIKDKCYNGNTDKEQNIIVYPLSLNNNLHIIAEYDFYTFAIDNYATKMNHT